MASEPPYTMQVGRRCGDGFGEVHVRVAGDPVVKVCPVCTCEGGDDEDVLATVALSIETFGFPPIRTVTADG